MQERKELGWISSASFGLGGYQDCMIGLSVTLEGKGWGVCDFWGDWAIERSDRAQWSEDGRVANLGNAVMRVNKLLQEAGRPTVDKLAGTPIEATFNGMTLKDWRVLTEVIKP